MIYPGYRLGPGQRERCCSAVTIRVVRAQRSADTYQGPFFLLFFVTVHLEPVGKYEAFKAAANGRTLEVVPHCRPLEDEDFPGCDVASSSLKLTDA